MYYLKFFLFIICVVTLINGCSEQSKRSIDLPSNRAVSAISSDNMVLVNQSFAEILRGDDLSSKSLETAIKYSIAYLNRISPNTVFEYGNLDYSATEIIASYELFLDIVSREKQSDKLLKALEHYFYMFQSKANLTEDGVLFTGYYEPLFEGSLEKSEEYNVPVYRLPKDLKVLELGEFRDTLQNRTIVYRFENENVVPYYSRQQIMQKKVLDKQNKPIAWMKDPVDLFFMQIQGSGMIVLPSGKKVRLSYAGSNGQPYSSIGKLLVDTGLMELEEVSMYSIRQYLKNNPSKRDDVLFHNQSYTFFELDVDPRGPKGNLNVPLTQHRSIATDSNIFPKAALSYIIAEMPTFKENWYQFSMMPFARFAVIQDTGGAIKGPGRVDLFWGNGKLAEKSAGSMRSLGKLYILIAKKQYISQPNLDPPSD